MDFVFLDWICIFVWFLNADDCWALALSKILEFSYNKDCPIGSYKELDVERFIREVKLSINELKANKKLDHMELAVGSLKKAMDHLYNPGIGKKDGKKVQCVWTLVCSLNVSAYSVLWFMWHRFLLLKFVGTESLCSEKWVSWDR